MNLLKKYLNLQILKLNFLLEKLNLKEKKLIQENLINGKINFLLELMLYFKKKLIFKNLGLVIIDEQHKFGVKQRIELSKKGGKDCDILINVSNSYTKNFNFSIYGDMDVSRLIEKPDV